MQRFMLQMSFILALVFAGIWSTGTALADNPDWPGYKKRENNRYEEKRENDREERRENYREEERRENFRDSERRGNHRYDRTPAYGFSDRRDRRDGHKSEYFSDHKRKFIHEYYSDRFRKGRCPPGFIRKGSRCISPGHAKMWRKGRPLPREVIYHDLPPTILVQLGAPPPRHRFVRVNQDILLISIGAGIVLDAFEDIDRLD